MHVPVRIKLHRGARDEWRAFLAALPGRHRADVPMLVEEYLKACAKDMAATIARGGSATVRWTCLFAPEYELFLGPRRTAEAYEITILGVRRVEPDSPGE